MRLVLIILFIGTHPAMYGQFSESDRNYINKQIQYINESVHGLLIAHRLFEGYNQEINKFLDLPSHKINNFDNADLPENIFGERNKLFFDKPPDQLYNELLIDSRRKNTALDSWPLISQMRALTRFANSERLNLGQMLSENRLNQLVTIQKVFLGLENAASYYQDFNNNISAFETALLQPYHEQTGLESSQKQVYTALVEIHYDIKSAIRFVRNEERSGVIEIISKIEKESNWLKTCITKLSSPNDQKALSEIFEMVTEVKNEISRFSAGAISPEEYAMYGPEYYTYNVKLLTHINRYGNGYVSMTNSFFKQAGWKVLHFMEEAHLVKVVYPEKVPKEAIGPKVKPPTEVAPPEITTSANTPIQEEEKLNIVVAKPKEIPISIRSTHTILVDSVVFNLDLFDHRIKDGDLISINVNGEWLFEHISLEKESRLLKLTIDPTTDNYILIRADNEGWRPPNTLGVRYISKGQNKNFFLIQDLTTNQAVEIKYRKG